MKEQRIVDREASEKSIGAETECTEGATPPKVQSRDHEGAEQGSCVTCLRPGVE